MEDDDAFLPSSNTRQSAEQLQEMRQAYAASKRTGSQSQRLSGEWSTRLSTGGSGSMSNRRDSVPPTRTGLLKPEDNLKVDPLRLVKVDSNPLVNQALETLSVIERQKQAQKEIKTVQQDSFEAEWETNLSSWKNRRKSKTASQLKALELREEDDMETTSGKRPKTFKELMEEKEKRTNGHGMYTYEQEQNPSFEAMSAKLSKPATRTMTAPATATAELDLHSKTSEPSVLLAEAPSKPFTGEFYFTSSTLGGPDSEVASRNKSDHSSSPYPTEPKKAAVYQKAHEIEIESQVPSADLETKELVRQRTSVETMRSSGVDSNKESRPWQSAVRQKSEISATKSVNSYGVTLREKPTGAPQTRPSSYAHTSSVGGIEGLTKATRSEATRPQVHTLTTTKWNDSSTTREGRQTNRAANSLPPEALSRDRRVKSNWELSFGQTFTDEKSDRSQLKPSQKSGAENSSAKFKQALSLFQSKEAVASQPVLTKTPSHTLTTQRSIGKVEDSKSYNIARTNVETKGPSPSDRPYKPSTDIRGGYQKDAVRIREFSRSAHGLDMHRSESGVPYTRNSLLDLDGKSRDRDNKYGSMEFETKPATSNSSSIESCSIRSSILNTQANDDEKEKTLLEKPGKIPMYRDKNEVNNYKVEVDSSGSKFGLDTAENTVNSTRRAQHDGIFDRQKLVETPERGILVSKYGSSYESRLSGTNATSGNLSNDYISVSSASRNLKTLRNDDDDDDDDDDHKPGKKVINLEGDEIGERKIKDAIPDWKMDQKRGTLTKIQATDSSEPKSLYAFKYSSTNYEESIVPGSEREKQATMDEEMAIGLDERSFGVNDRRFGSTKAMATLVPAYKDSYKDLRDERKQEGGAPQCVSTSRTDISKYLQKEPITMPQLGVPDKVIFGRDSSQHVDSAKQSSISDIFSKRSAAAVRNKVLVTESDSDTLNKSSPAVETAPNIPYSRRTHEMQATIHNEKKIGDSACEQKGTSDTHDGDRAAKTKTKHANAGGTSSDVNIVQDDKSRGETYSNITSSRRESREPYSSTKSEQQFELQRASYTSVTTPDKIPTDSEIPRGHAVTMNKPEEEKKLQYGHRQDPVFEINFSITEMEKIKTESGKFALPDQNKTNEPPNLRKFQDSSVNESSERKEEEVPKTKNEFRYQFDQREDIRHSVGKHAADDYGESESSPIGDWENSKKGRDDFHFELKTKNIFGDNKSSDIGSSEMLQIADKEPGKLHCNLHEALVVDFYEPDSAKCTDATQKQTHEHYKTSQRNTTAYDSRDLLVEIPQQKQAPLLPEESISRVRRPPSLHEITVSEIRRSPLPEDRLMSPIQISPLPKERLPSPLPSPNQKSLQDRSLASGRSPKQVDPIVPPVADKESPVRNAVLERLTISDKPDDRLSMTNSESLSSISEASFKEKETSDEKRKIDRNSNVPLDLPSSSSRSDSLLHELQSPSDPSFSFSKRKSEFQILPTESDRSPESNGDLPKDNLSSSEKGRETSSSVKKKPPEPPKPKPKPKILKEAEVLSPAKDDWSFLSNAQILDTSAIRDKCRLTQSGVMAARRRPKSAILLLEETDDLSVSSLENSRSSLSHHVNGRQEDLVDFRVDNRPDLHHVPANSSKPRANLHGASPRPLSYMGELNSSLAKKFKEIPNPVIAKEQISPHTAPNGDVTAAGTELKTPDQAPFSYYQKPEEVSERHEIEHREDEQTMPMDIESSPNSNRKTTDGVQIPGFLESLNASFKKRFKESVQQSSAKENETPQQQFESDEDLIKKSTFQSPDIPTGDLLNFETDDKDKDIGDEESSEAPPPLPDAPPPFPNWNSFPGAMINPPSSGPPPLIDLSFPDEEEAGKLEFRVEKSGQYQTSVRGQNWWEEDENEMTSSSSKADEKDFSFV